MNALLLGWVASTVYLFVVSNPPYGGYCKAVPKTGEATTTIFNISCHGWKGESSDLQYSIALHQAKTGVKEAMGDSDSTVLSYGSLSYVTTTLPEGREFKNSSMQLKIRIFDLYGASTHIFLTVQVLTSLLHILKYLKSLPVTT